MEHPELKVKGDNDPVDVVSWRCSKGWKGGSINDSHGKVVALSLRPEFGLFCFGDPLKYSQEIDMALLCGG